MINLLEKGMPRASCMPDIPGIDVHYFISNALIAIAYFGIPVLIHLIKTSYEKRSNSQVKFHHVFTAFKAFITLCGLTHVMDCIMLWYAWYVINVILLYLTTAVSLFTGILLIRIFAPLVLSLKNANFESELSKNLQELIQIKKNLMI